MRFRGRCARYALVLVLGLVLLSFRAAAEPVSPQYLLFQIFTGSPDPRSGIFHRGRSKEELSGIVRQIAQTVRPSRGDPSRLLGFAVGPIAMDEGAEEARSVIRDAFDIALETDMAVAVHLDDYMFWSQARWPDGRLLASAQNSAEWTDWSARPASGLAIGWMPNVKLAPQLCYESPQVREFVAYWTRDVIGREVKRQVDRLARAGKQRLFAGVIVGWESNLAHGYCSLSQLGYSAANPPADFDRERERVLQRHIERWAKGVHDAGIPTAQLFTHIAPITRHDYEQVSRMLPRSRIREIPQSTAFRAFWTAFNQYSNPGFSAYPADGKFADIYEALATYGERPWAMAEGTNAVLGPHGPERSPLGWETYLARSFNHGARLVNLFGGFQGGNGADEFKRSTESEPALAAYRKFLRGDQLVEGAAR